MARQSIPIPNINLADEGRGELASPDLMEDVIDLDAPDVVDSTEIENDDGSVTINIGPDLPIEDDEDTEIPSEKWFENIADKLPSEVLSEISNELIEGIEADNQSRQEWLQDRAELIKMLGLKVSEETGTPDGGGAPLLGMASVRHPLLLEAVLQFRATARGELLPADGPVKVTVDGETDRVSDDLADALEDGMNHYLTVTATEFYPDTDRLLFGVGWGGAGFKKVYICPLRKRPVSESVDAEKLIVSNNATDLQNALRVTEEIEMDRVRLKRMQALGAYRDIELGEPENPEISAPDQAKSEQQGIVPVSERPQDSNYTIYECYCYLDIKGYEDKGESGKASGVPLPWKVTIEKGSQQILEVRRDWNQADTNKLRRKLYVLYPFELGFGFWPFGLGHMLSNANRAVSAAWRMLLDNGMVSNFPGFLYAKGAGKQNSLDFRIPAGGGQPIDISGSATGKIQDAVMGLPYRDVSPQFAGFADAIAQAGQRLAGTTQIAIGEGKQDAPVGTTLAMLEQSKIIPSDVHKRLHAAMAEEFQLLKERFREDPSAFWRFRNGGTEQWDEQKLLEALDRADLTPRSDPNVPSHMHRVQKALFVKQLATTNPQLYDQREVDLYVLSQIKVGDAESLMMPPQPVPPPDPMMQAMQQGQVQLVQAKVAETNAKAQEAQSRHMERMQKLQMAMKESEAQMQKDLMETQMDDAQRTADRESREKIAAMQVAAKLVDSGNENVIPGPFPNRG
ncbi:hypothetical protein [Chelatococcus sp.]|uniref:portal protein n=1 Tax=Chelatococcus sp. TaxID=1953771 RepID=UPI001EB1EC66|nr:hypothetical protein [Chelatococcus sp.]MBX3547318.1 hypothetical protein [Chelatococcus sp.]CAH1677960.1 conserved hypothetical protein [Hyphomicrobiales bacterium]